MSRYRLDGSQRRVYGAEAHLKALLTRASDRAIEYRIHGSTLVLPAEQWFQSLEQVQRYVDKIVTTRKARDILGAWVNVEVIEPPYADAGDYRKRSDGTSLMRLAAYDGEYRELEILHELAHHVSSGHGDAFVYTYTNLIDGFMSPEVAYVLKDLLRNEE